MSARVRMAIALAGFLWTAACANEIDQGGGVAADTRNDTTAVPPSADSAHATDAVAHGQHGSGQVGRAVNTKVGQPADHDAHPVLVNGATDAPQNGHAVHVAVNSERSSGSWTGHTAARLHTRRQRRHAHLRTSMKARLQSSIHSPVRSPGTRWSNNSSLAIRRFAASGRILRSARVC
jgi:hypothetical protein